MKLDLDLSLNRKNIRGQIRFDNADISFLLKNKTALRNWLHSVANERGFALSHVQYVFCSDDYLLNVNRDFLHHDYFTDIITFDLSEKKGEICSEIYISIPRVKDNAITYGVSFYDELHRVLAHGILHLCGLKDKTAKQEKEMRKAENHALLMRNF